MSVPIRAYALLCVLRQAPNYASKRSDDHRDKSFVIPEKSNIMCCLLIFKRMEYSELGVQMKWRDNTLFYKLKIIVDELKMTS